jgi:hypothetical protein
MGYRQVQVVITANLSNHNDDRDKRDEALWADLTAQVKAIVSDPKYDDIIAMTC